MPGKRSTTPLFDLLQQGRGRGVEVRAPEPEFERPRVAAAPAEAGGASPSGRFAEIPVRLVGGVVQMPLAYAVVALAVALAAILGAWTLGYRRGEGQARSEQAMLESVMGGSARVVEPGGGGETGTGRAGGASPGPGSPRDEGGGAADGETSSGPASFLTASGGSETDPRRAGQNYLYLAAQLEADAARSAIDHLASRGIEAFAEIDPRYLRRKNGPLYSLIAGRGIPGDEVRSDAAEQYKQQLLAAGAAWKKDGGKWDFADAYWMKHNPEQGN